MPANRFQQPAAYNRWANAWVENQDDPQRGGAPGAPDPSKMMRQRPKEGTHERRCGHAG